MDSTTEQIILGELRGMRRDIGEISISLRVDTTWTRIREHFRYGVDTMRAIPLAVRVLIFMATFIIAMGLAYKVPKLTAVGIEVLMLSLVAVGGE